jgi:hypothetical protein
MFVCKGAARTDAGERSAGAWRGALFAIASALEFSCSYTGVPPYVWCQSSIIDSVKKGTIDH